MLRLLLDSHILLWWDRDLSRLSESQNRAISDSANRVWISAATAWELAIKSASGRLILSESVQAIARRLGFEELPISFEHAERAAGLNLIHRDPFDRMLVAQALVEGLTLVTADRRLAEYPVALL